MRLLLFTVVFGVLIALVATTRPNADDDTVIVAMAADQSNDDVFVRGMEAKVEIVRLLGMAQSPVGRFALVKRNSLTEEARSILGVWFVINSYGLLGCAESTDSIPARGIGLSTRRST